MTDKKSIRKEIFQRRKSADPEALIEKSRRICERVMELEAFQSSDTLFTYVDFNREVETCLLIRTAWAMGKKVAAPRVSGKNMDFYLIEKMEDLEPGYFGIPEPIAAQPLACDEACILIVPGVAFDQNCHRAGYGQGFYDRYLEKHPNHKTVAVAFDFQIVDEVPSETTDICPQLVITETAVYHAATSSEDANPKNR
ncbi:MAG: 5-formyltetrahydrofolate cyclo-ligase [Lachnospiraceae bacterium]|nr:5-formyltetrahydrofolate cyclo-ligase [Lachnospiraceae bacterium]